MIGRRLGARQAGFTLLEVLIAVVILGLLVVGLSQGVRAGLSLRQAQSRRIDQTADLDATMRLLRELLSRLPVVPEGTRLIAKSTGAPFQGEADRLSFVAGMPTGVETSRLADMTLSAADGQLMLSWTPHYHEYTAAVRQPTRTGLLHNVDRLELAYRGSPGPGQPAGWLSRWQSPMAPELVRLRVVFAKGDHRHWPDLVVAPRM